MNKVQWNIVKLNFKNRNETENATLKDAWINNWLKIIKIIYTIDLFIMRKISSYLNLLIVQWHIFTGALEGKYL